MTQHKAIVCKRVTNLHIGVHFFYVLPPNVEGPWPLTEACASLWGKWGSGTGHSTLCILSPEVGWFSEKRCYGPERNIGKRKQSGIKKNAQLFDFFCELLLGTVSEMVNRNRFSNGEQKFD